MTVKPLRPSQERANPLKEKQELLTDPVFIIGNGTSRESFDLERLRPIGTIIGCNALFRDFSPDILVSIDSKMITEISKSGYALENFCIIPGNRTAKLAGAASWRTDRFNTSGCFAMRLVSLLMNPVRCYMLGMDGYPGNVYDSTQNYSDNTLQNFNGISSFYMKTLIGGGDTIFVNVNIKDSWPKEAHDTGRYEFMTYDKFEKVLC